MSTPSATTDAITSDLCSFLFSAAFGRTPAKPHFDFVFRLTRLKTLSKLLFVSSATSATVRNSHLPLGRESAIVSLSFVMSSSSLHSFPITFSDMSNLVAS